MAAAILDEGEVVTEFGGVQIGRLYGGKQKLRSFIIAEFRRYLSSQKNSFCSGRVFLQRLQELPGLWALIHMVIGTSESCNRLWPLLNLIWNRLEPFDRVGIIFQLFGYHPPQQSGSLVAGPGLKNPIQVLPSGLQVAQLELVRRQITAVGWVVGIDLKSL